MSNTKTSINSNKVNNTSTFEQWKDLTNEMATLFQETVVMGSTVGNQNAGNIILDGNIELDTGHHIKVDDISASTGADRLTITEEVKILGDLILNQPGAGSAASVLQFQNASSTNTWHIKTNTDHSILEIGTASRILDIHTDGNITTGTDVNQDGNPDAGSFFTFSNDLLGSDISGVTIGANSQTTGQFTSVSASTGFTGSLTGDVDGDLTGDVRTENGFVILDNGNGTNVPATFTGNVTGDLTGDVYASNGTKILESGTGANAQFTGSVVGNASTSSRFFNSVDIGGVGFTGQTDIDLPGVNEEGNQDTTGNAATASEIYVTNTDTADPNLAVTLAPTNGSTSTNRLLYSDDALKFNPGTNTLTLGGNGHITTGTIQANTFTGALSGNATTASTLQTPRTIGGVTFSGGSDINLPGVNNPGNQNTSGNAATSSSCSGNAASASKWATTRTLGFTSSSHLEGSWSVNGTASVNSNIKVKDGVVKTTTANITDLEGYIGNLVSVNRIWPVGSVFISTAHSTQAQMRSAFGSNTNWQLIAPGRVLVGHGGSYVNGAAAGNSSHKLTVAQMPKHNHTVNTGETTNVQLYKSTVTNIREFRDGSQPNGRFTTNKTNQTGGSSSFSLMQPYLVVYMWKRLSDS